MTDNILTCVIISILLIVTTFGISYGEFKAAECKIEAIKHNVPPLEIKEICK